MKQTQTDYHEFAALIEMVRDKALLLNDGERDPFWMPRSQILINGNPCLNMPLHEGLTITVSAPTWLAAEKKLIEDPRVPEAKPGGPA